MCTVEGSAGAYTLTALADGPCILVASQAGDAAYSAASDVTKTVTVLAKLVQTIMFDQPANMLVPDPSVPLSAKSDSELPVIITSNSTDVCDVSNVAGTYFVQPISAGTCTLVTSQAGDVFYAPAAPVTRSFDVRLATLTLTFDQPIDMPSYGPSPQHLQAQVNLDLPVQLLLASSSVTNCTLIGQPGNYWVVALHAGTCELTASATAPSGYATINSITRSFTVFPFGAPTVVDASVTTVATAPVTLSPEYSSTAPIDWTQTCLGYELLCASEVTVDGQGTWKINKSNSSVTFTALPGFIGTTTPVYYQLTDTKARSGRGSMSVTVTMPATPTISISAVRTPAQTPVVLHPTITGTALQAQPVLYPAYSPPRGAAQSWTVPNVGTYQVQANRDVLFTPAQGFYGRTPSVFLRITDSYAQSASAALVIIVDALPIHLLPAPAITSGFNKAGTVKLTLATGSAPATSWCLPSGRACSSTRTTPQGLWKVSSSGFVSLSPSPCFTGTAGPVQVRANAAGSTDTTTVSALIRPGVKHKAQVTVYFPVLSSTVNSAVRSQLVRIARQATAGCGCNQTINSVGYVMATQNTNNDQILSRARARELMEILVSAGMKARITLSGAGVAREGGAKARRAMVTVTWIT